MKLFATINVDFDTTGQIGLLIIYAAVIKYLRRNGNAMGQ
jgi:hypothetical protein